MCAAASDNRKIAVFATSMGRGMRPSGMRSRTRSTPASPPFMARKRGVSIGPGAMQLARTPSAAARAAKERVKAITPAFAAL